MPEPPHWKDAAHATPYLEEDDEEDDLPVYGRTNTTPHYQMPQQHRSGGGGHHGMTPRSRAPGAWSTAELA